MVQNQEGMKEELEKLSEQAAEMHRREWNVCVCVCLAEGYIKYVFESKAPGQCQCVWIACGLTWLLCRLGFFAGMRVATFSVLCRR